MLKPVNSQEDDARELILFDCLYMVCFKLHFAGNSITMSCPVIVFIIKRRPFNSNILKDKLVLSQYIYSILI